MHDNQSSWPFTCDLSCGCRGITFNRTPAQVINILTQHPSGKGLFFPEGASIHKLRHFEYLLHPALESLPGMSA